MKVLFRRARLRRVAAPFLASGTRSWRDNDLGWADFRTGPILKKSVRRAIAAIASRMRHLEARDFQDFATIGKEFAGRVLGAADFRAVRECDV